jgi:hypothetical protein
MGEYYSNETEFVGYKNINEMQLAILSISLTNTNKVKNISPTV